MYKYISRYIDNWGKIYMKHTRICMPECLCKKPGKFISFDFYMHSRFSFCRYALILTYIYFDASISYVQIYIQTYLDRDMHETYKDMYMISLLDLCEPYIPFGPR
jgi:hypothetical protein